MSAAWSFPWEQDASRGAETPDGLSLADQMAYTALRSIYGDFHDGRMDRHTASAEKRKLRRAWEKAREAEAFDRKLTEWHARLVRNIEQAACRCRKEPTAANALRLCDVIDGVERP